MKNYLKNTVKGVRGYSKRKRKGHHKSTSKMKIKLP